MGRSKLRIAVVGIRFGAEFVPIYQRHPDVGEVVLCDTNLERLNEVGDRFGVRRRFTDVDALLAAPDIDAVHLLTPVLLHAQLGAERDHFVRNLHHANAGEGIDAFINKRPAQYR